MAKLRFAVTQMRNFSKSFGKRRKLEGFKWFCAYSQSCTRWYFRDAPKNSTCIGWRCRGVWVALKVMLKFIRDAQNLSVVVRYATGEPKCVRKGSDKFRW